MTSRRRFLAALAAGPLAAADWSAYRGSGDGVSDVKNLPLEWGPQKNIAWGADLPGAGSSAPVIYQGLVFVTSAISQGGQDFLAVTALDLKSGAQRWSRRFVSSRQGLSGLASSTPCVESGRLYVFMASGDFSCLDFDGNVLWTRRLNSEMGPLAAPHGPVCAVRRTREHVLVFASRPDSSFLLAVDPQQGKTDWKAERPAPAAFWNTPVVIQSWQREVVVLAADGQLEGYSAHDGQTLWRRSGLPPAAFEPAPAELPRTGEGVVLVPFSTPGGMGCYKPLPAGREPAEVWRTTTPSACPLLAFEGVAYALDPAGRLAAVDLQSGAALWSQPLPGDHPLPPVAAGDRVYFFRRDGACTVLASGRKFAPLAFNTIGSAGGVHAAVPFDGGFLFRAADRLTRVSAAAASKPRYEWGAKP